MLELRTGASWLAPAVCTLQLDAPLPLPRPPRTSAPAHMSAVRCLFQALSSLHALKCSVLPLSRPLLYSVLAGCLPSIVLSDHHEHSFGISHVPATAPGPSCVLTHLALTTSYEGGGSQQRILRHTSITQLRPEREAVLFCNAPDRSSVRAGILRYYDCRSPVQAQGMAYGRCSVSPSA